MGERERGGRERQTETDSPRERERWSVQKRETKREGERGKGGRENWSVQNRETERERERERSWQMINI